MDNFTLGAALAATPAAASETATYTYDTQGRLVKVAHSGTVAGLLFDPYDPLGARRIADARGEITALGFDRPWLFSTTEADPLDLRGAA